jgi:hypothetical protein
MKINKPSPAYILAILGLISLLTILGLGGYASYAWYQQYSYKKLTKQAIIQPVRVFQIGFSKCGTISIAEFFRDNGIATIHHDFGNLAVSMHENALHNKPLIPEHYQQYYVFTDMERMDADPIISIPILYFKELDKQYPGSKFILNTRNKEAWLRSRSKHLFNVFTQTSLLNESAKILKLSEQEVVEHWSQEWDDHHAAVLEHFKDRPQDLLVFNIDTDKADKLIAFLQGNFKLNAKYYGHKNRTTDKQDKTKLSPIEFYNKDYAFVTAAR